MLSRSASVILPKVGAWLQERFQSDISALLNPSFLFSSLYSLSAILFFRLFRPLSFDGEPLLVSTINTTISRTLRRVNDEKHLYSFNIRQNLSTHFTRTNYGYLNSTIIFVMVTASINANEGHVSASVEAEASGSLLGVFRMKTYNTISLPWGHVDTGSGTRYRV